MKEEIIKDNFIGGLVTDIGEYLLPENKDENSGLTVISKTPDCNNLLPFGIGISKKRPGMAQTDDIERLWGVDYSVLYMEEFNTLADGYITMVGNIDEGIHEIYQYIPAFVGYDTGTTESSQKDLIIQNWQPEDDYS